MWTSQASGLRKAAATIRSTPHHDPGIEDTKEALSCLGFSPGVHDERWTAIPEDADHEVFLKALFDMIEEHFQNDPEAAAAALDRPIAEREQSIKDRLVVDRPGAVHAMVLSDFLRNLERGQAHISRETDRALRRFHKAKAIAVGGANGSAPDASADDM